ncbi:MAG TPA: ABC transporter ATP-binding protein, partial [Candidatus Binatus sp.]|nr:ABC transporter ATP-binding protein [Candidatus Binatus sp.]
MDNKPALQKSTLRQYLTMLTRVSRWHLIGAVVVSVLFSLTEGAGFALLLPTLQVAGFNMVGQGEAGRYATMVSNGFLAIGVRPSLILLLGVFVMLVGARTVIGQVQSVWMYAVEQEMAHHLRQRIYHAIADANWLFLCRSRGSDFTHALTYETFRVGTGTNLALILAGEVVLCILYMSIAFALSAGMTTLVLLSGGLLAFLFRGRTHAIEAQGEEVSATSKSLYSATIEHFQSLKAAKTYGAEERNFSIFSGLSSEVEDANMDGARQQATAATLFELGSVMILAAVLFVSIRVLAVPPASILILLLVVFRVMPRIMSSQQHYRAFVNMLPSFANLMNIEARSIAAAEAVAHPHDQLLLTRELAAEGISFTYSEGRVAAVRDLNMVIPAGKVVALVGPSGAGKSTIAD